MYIMLKASPFPSRLPLCLGTIPNAPSLPCIPICGDDVDVAHGGLEVRVQPRQLMGDELIKRLHLNLRDKDHIIRGSSSR